MRSCDWLPCRPSKLCADRLSPEVLDVILITFVAECKTNSECHSHQSHRNSTTSRMASRSISDRKSALSSFNGIRKSKASPLQCVLRIVEFRITDVFSSVIAALECEGHQKDRNSSSWNYNLEYAAAPRHALHLTSGIQLPSPAPFLQRPHPGTRWAYLAPVMPRHSAHSSSYTKCLLVHLPEMLSVPLLPPLKLRRDLLRRSPSHLCLSNGPSA